MDKYLELYIFLRYEAEKLVQEFEDMLPIVRKEEFPAKLENFVEKLRHLTDHAVHEIEDLKPTSPQAKEFKVTDELCEETFRAGLAAKDFSIGFLQRHFQIGYAEAGELQWALVHNKKIARAFLAGEVLCKG